MGIEVTREELQAALMRAMSEINRLKPYEVKYNNAKRDVADYQRRLADLGETLEATKQERDELFAKTCSHSVDIQRLQAEKVFWRRACVELTHKLTEVTDRNYDKLMDQRHLQGLADCINGKYNLPRSVFNDMLSSRYEREFINNEDAHITEDQSYYTRYSGTRCKRWQKTIVRVWRDHFRIIAEHECARFLSMNKEDD